MTRGLATVGPATTELLDPKVISTHEPSVESDRINEQRVVDARLSKALVDVAT
jgi:hypothetical protein